MLLAFVAVYGFLLLSKQLGWFGFDEDKDNRLVIAVAAVAVPILLMAFWVVVRWAFRRRLQYSLRTLLIFVTLCAVLCSGLGYKRRVEQHRELIRQEFRQLGYDVNWDSAHWWSMEPTYASFTPNNYFHLPRLYTGNEITDDQLNELKPRLQSVEILFLDGTAVTDRGMEHFEDMKELRALGLGSTAVTDVGLRHLAQLTRLEALFLGGTGIPDRDVAWYARFCKRQDLTTPVASKVTDAGMASLRQLTRLRQLNLRMTDVTDSGLSSSFALFSVVCTLSRRLAWLGGRAKLKSASRPRLGRIGTLILPPTLFGKEAEHGSYRILSRITRGI